VVLVQNELDHEPREPFIEPVSDNFMAFQSRAGVTAFTRPNKLNIMIEFRLTDRSRSGSGRDVRWI
jgi:hypothetical protein